MIRVLFAGSALALTVVLAACGGGSSGKTTPAGTAKPATGPSNGPGSLIVTRPAGIGVYDLSNGRGSLLIPLPDRTVTLIDPDVSPDGSRIAYIAASAPNLTFDAGSDLWTANRDGSGQKLAFTHEAPNQQVRAPRWLDDGHVEAIVQEPVTKNGFSTFTYTLERIALADGKREKLADNIIAFDLSPDRTRGVFALTTDTTGETLATGNADGSGLTTIVGLDQNLQPFNSPRYSPDGSRIAFASADQTGATLDAQYVAARPIDAPAPAPLPDGLPEDIWIVDAAGGKAQRVATLKEDLPTLAWSGDGKHIYVLGAQATYDVNVTSGSSTNLGAGSFHGQIAWAPSQ